MSEVKCDWECTAVTPVSCRCCRDPDLFRTGHVAQQSFSYQPESFYKSSFSLPSTSHTPHTGYRRQSLDGHSHWLLCLSALLTTTKFGIHFVLFSLKSPPPRDGARQVRSGWLGWILTLNHPLLIISAMSLYPGNGQPTASTNTGTTTTTGEMPSPRNITSSPISSFLACSMTSYFYTLVYGIYYTNTTILVKV